MQQRVELHDAQARIALHVGALQPVECKVRRAAIRVSLRNLLGGPFRVLLAEFPQCRIRLGRFPARVVYQRGTQEMEVSCPSCWNSSSVRFLREQRSAQFFYDRLGDVVLHGEDILQLTVIGLRPQCESVATSTSCALMARASRPCARCLRERSPR